MGIQADLKRIKLRMTPRRAAVKYLEWMHTVTVGGYPLNDLRTQLGSDASKGYMSEAARERACERAELQMCYLINIYSFTVCTLLDQLLRLVNLLTFAEPHCKFERESCPELFKRLTRACNQVATTYAVVEKIEAEYLRAQVMPKYLRTAVSELHRRANITRELVADPSKGNKGLMQPADCAEWASKNVSKYASNSWAFDDADLCAITFQAHFMMAEHRFMTAFEDLGSFTRLSIEREKRELAALKRMANAGFTPTIEAYLDVTHSLRTGQDLASELQLNE